VQSQFYLDFARTSNRDKLVGLSPEVIAPGEQLPGTFFKRVNIK
jgi:hypothetical protein